MKSNMISNASYFFQYGTNNNTPNTFAIGTAANATASANAAATTSTATAFTVRANSYANTAATASANANPFATATGIPLTPIATSTIYPQNYLPGYYMIMQQPLAPITATTPTIAIAQTNTAADNSDTTMQQNLVYGGAVNPLVYQSIAGLPGSNY